MFTVDGLQWTIPCDIRRAAEVRASSISGLMLNGTYFNDVLGTYLKYTIKLVVPLNERAAFNPIYEKITDPVGHHTFTFPYNQTTVTVTGKAENIKDVFVRLPNGGQYWKGIEFDVTACAPTKTQTEAEAIAYGLPPLPLNVAPNVGDTYTWNGEEWELVSSGNE